MLDLKDYISLYEDYVINLRRFFHEYPELSGEEINTSMKIREELDKMNIEYEIVGDFGIIGTLKGRNQGKTIALRADMDALPIPESEFNLSQKKSIISSISNISHACGHDGHSAMLLGTAKILSDLRNSFDGTILFCFEQGEEDGSGVLPMLEKLEPKNVDAMWGIHLYSELPSGMICVDEGPRMSGATVFSVNISGKGGHGSSPHQTIDPINCTVQIISNLSSILSRELNPIDTGVLTIGHINAGKAPNVIPDSALFSGTMRYFDLDIGAQIIESFKRIVFNTASAHNCIVNLTLDGPGYPVINDSNLSFLAKTSIENSIGKEFLTSCKPWMASESMSRYLRKYPGVFAFLGINNTGLGTGAPHHNPSFDIDESCLKNGVASSVQFALDFLKS
ncbi:amidohydrolase, peptidase M20 family [Gottschalkia acidurici 9a]|uniref:Amidohydrolase, peptidase M20 family n=1 Tax=Gottschalkia acidurici (strain ATCC 7906 / DSM 604 / BCRC 14475 / CIP 104303 / KCTC 5404 / NCIMB 10678 / 9a) TaxID=1128398 RepID=K0B0R8_GOTA9|nr:amidohydrolase, peptidase M20 family [Gottschalkia acidurici 9a]